MPTYEFQCEDGHRHELSTRQPYGPCFCGSILKRKFSFHIGQTIPGHFNHAVGKYVSNDREFRDALKVKSEEQSERLGIEHNYTYVDPADKQALGVTEEGLDSTHKQQRDLKMAVDHE